MLEEALVQLGQILIAGALLTFALCGAELARDRWDQWRADRAETNAAKRLASASNVERLDQAELRESAARRNR